MENETEGLDSLKPEDEISDSLFTEEMQDGETAEEKVAKLAEINKGLFARAKRAEEENKAFKQVPKESAPKAIPTGDDLDKVLEEKLNERELASMELSDELKSEVRAYAKTKGITYREASKSDYISFVKDRKDKEAREVDASVSSTNKTSKAKRDFGKLSDEQVRELEETDFDEYKKWLKSQ